MAFYYIVAAVETEDGGLTADVPEGIAWVGQPHTDGTYLVKTLVEVAGTTALTEAELAAESDQRGLLLAEVRQVWAIGGET